MSTIKIYYDSNYSHDCDSLVETWTGSARYGLPYDVDNYELGESRESDEKWLKENTVAYYPVYAYIHGGMTIRTTPFSCSWDSGQLGWAYISKEAWRDEMGVKRISSKQVGRAKNLIKAELKELDEVLQGKVYGFVAPNGDSCFGFVGGDIKTNGMLDYIDEAYHADAIKAFEEGNIT